MAWGKFWIVVVGLIAKTLNIKHLKQKKTIVT